MDIVKHYIREKLISIRQKKLPKKRRTRRPQHNISGESGKTNVNILWHGFTNIPAAKRQGKDVWSVQRSK